MFILLKVKDTVRIAPADLHLLDRDMMTCIRKELHAKYANRVLPDQGLVVAVHSILAHNAPQVYAGDGGAHIRATFRLIVFQPFESEVIVGQIKLSTPAGIHVSVGFFDYIFVPAANLPQPSRFEPSEQAWVWEWGDQEFYLDLQQKVRIRVQSLKYVTHSERAAEATAGVDPLKLKATTHGYLLSQTQEETDTTKPQGSAAAANKAFAEQAKPAGGADASTPAYTPPFQVIATMAEHGLGAIEWW